jgi:8-oxo-dGTP pyrophosphatase MutT (NUDIX family)
MIADRDILKDLLLEDYRYRADALKSSEQSGETRFNIFIGLVTLVAGALVTLGTYEHGPSGDALRLIILGALVLLLVVGWMTLMRLLIRNKHTDLCKRNLDHIRQVFKDHFDDDGVLVGYYPVQGPRRTEPTKDKEEDLYKCPNADSKSWPALLKEDRDRGFGGMAHLMVAVNSLLLAGLAFFLAWPSGDTATFDAGSTQVLAAAGAAGLAFVVGFLLQWLFVIRREATDKGKLCRAEHTHAGGVVFRAEGGNISYLIIPPKNGAKDTWVLPKGHIHKNEGDGEAALREVEEETGVVARLICPLGVANFTVEKHGSQEDVRVKFYLMQSLFDAPGGPGERRIPQWLPYEQAQAELTHPEGKRILILAHARQQDIQTGRALQHTLSGNI